MEPDPRPMGLHTVAPHSPPQNLPHCQVPGWPEGQFIRPLGAHLFPQLREEGSQPSMSWGKD